MGDTQIQFPPKQYFNEPIAEFLNKNLQSVWKLSQTALAEIWSQKPGIHFAQEISEFAPK
jgi:hypothetical protein